MPDNGWIPSSTVSPGFVINGVTLYMGTGVPDNGLGANGDVYIRGDGTILATLIYRKAAGAWLGLGIA